MRAWRRSIALCVAAMVWVGLGQAAGASKAPVVTAATQVNIDPNPVRAHSTPLLARNPTNGELVVADVDVRGSRECMVHISTDDGRSWFPGGGIMVKPYTDCSIGAEYGPHVMPFFDRDGVLYVTTTASDPTVFASSSLPSNTAKGARAFVPRNVYLSRSTDGGRSFTTALVYKGPENDPGRGYNISPTGAVDPTDPRRVYIGWARGDWTSPKLSDTVEAVVAASSDGGKTFGEPVDLSTPNASEHTWLTVGRDGAVRAAYWSKGFGTPLASEFLPIPIARQDAPPIYYTASTDHGKTWNRQVIDPGNQKYYRPPVIAADPHSDAIYIAWYSTPEVMNFQDDGAGKVRSEIFLRASTDGGKTWAARKVVNDDAGKGANHELPGLSIAPNGRLDVAWDDFRLSPSPGASPDRENGIDNIFYASSSDHGATLGPNIQVNDRSIDRSIGVWSNNVGSHVAVGIASTANAVYFAWQDSRNGTVVNQSEDIYASSLRLNGTAAATHTAGAPRWLLLGAGIALGLGLAVFVWGLGRRQRRLG